MQIRPYCSLMTIYTIDLRFSPPSSFIVELHVTLFELRVTPHIKLRITLFELRVAKTANQHGAMSQYVELSFT